MKAWGATIDAHIQLWSQKLDSSRQWWPKFIYHFTDLNNAVSIIREGAIYSRVEATARGLMVCDNASPTLIAKTNPAHLGYARFYFRPGTPTQFRNEGIRPAGKRWRPDPNEPEAHCAVPVFFLFDASKMLKDDRASYSRGNMAARNPEFGPNESNFTAIPFEYVFHSGSYPRETGGTIPYHRQAEVLIPDAYQLDNTCVSVVCRSTAERQTLLHKLPADLRTRWEPLVRLGKGVGASLFQRQWTYVDTVAGANGLLTFHFNPNTILPGPFRVQFEYVEDGTLRSWTGSWVWDQTIKPRPVDLTKAAPTGVAKLWLDECLAFEARVQLRDLPF